MPPVPAAFETEIVIAKKIHALHATDPRHLVITNIGGVMRIPLVYVVHVTSAAIVGFAHGVAPKVIPIHRFAVLNGLADLFRLVGVLVDVMFPYQHVDHHLHIMLGTYFESLRIVLAHDDVEVRFLDPNDQLLKLHGIFR